MLLYYVIYYEKFKNVMQWTCLELFMFLLVCQKMVQETQLITNEIYMPGSSTTWAIDGVWLTNIEYS